MLVRESPNLRLDWGLMVLSAVQRRLRSLVDYAKSLEINRVIESYLLGQVSGFAEDLCSLLSCQYDILVIRKDLFILGFFDHEFFSLNNLYLAWFIV